MMHIIINFISFYISLYVKTVSIKALFWTHADIIVS